MIKNKLKLLGVFVVASLCAVPSIKSNASSDTGFKVQAINVPGVENVFFDSDVPPALKIVGINSGKSSEDGLKVGDILYRHSHSGLDYYSPVVPNSLLGRVTTANHQNWGPWNMKSNNVSRQITSPEYYTTATLATAKTVETDDGSGVLGKTKEIGTLPSGTKLDVLGICTEGSKTYIYFDLTGYSGLKASAGKTNVGRVAKTGSSDITLSGYKATLYSGYTSDNLLKNFKAVGRYADNMRTYHKGIVSGKYYNPNESYVPSSVRNRYGEWRYLGYNALGQPLDNPFFPPDSINFYGAAKFSGYPWRLTPWNKNDAESDEWSVATAYNKFLLSGISEYDTNSKYATLKSNVMNRLVREGHITNASYYTNRLSLRTHPEKQPTVLLGQKKYETYYRTGFLPLEKMLRDIYIKRIRVYDLDDNNKVVATTTCNINGSCNIGTGNVYQGKRYGVEVVLANGAKSSLLKTTLEAQIGYRYNDSSTSLTMPYSSTSNRKVIRIGNSGGLVATLDDDSNPFNDSIYISNTQTGTIDVYGYVGASHTGVDNNIYTNDTGVVRLKIVTTTPPPVNNGSGGCTLSNNGNTKVCGTGDIQAYAIQLKDESGEQVYRHIYGSNPAIKKAPIPGNKYYIEYTAVYKGDNIMEYKWIDTVNDDPNTPANEYVAGHWSAGTPKSYTIPLNYFITKYSGGTSQVDSIVSNAQNNLSDVNFTSTTVTMRDELYLKFKTPYIMFQHPYLNTAFRVVPNDSRINSDTSNDRMEITINDNYDIAISNLKVIPQATFVANGATKVNYTVSYDANLSLPDYVSESDYLPLVNTAIMIGNKTFYVKDQLVKGSNGNKNITHIIENVDVGNASSVTATVNLNYDKASYESGNYNNNSASTSVGVGTVANPGSGNPSDTVKSPDSLNSNNPNKGGNANNNCLTPRTRNTWTSTHRKFSWNSNNITYQTLNTGANISFKKYYKTYENLNEATLSYEEEFGIQKILFRSKETKDNKYGDNGWVNLLDSKEKDLAIIKAGYGFELKIVTKYSTNAFSKVNWNTSNNGSSGTAVSALNGTVNLGLEDIFLELPGTKTTRKILSSTGYGDSTIGLVSSKKVTGDTVEWTYTIKPTGTLKVGETDKIYIPYNTKDGDYTLKIYTPPVAGVGSVNKALYSSLCDRKEVTIKVQGSATNDLNSHETQ